MGDFITSERGPGAPGLHVSNVRLSVLFNVLAVAVMPRARTDWELRLARWVVEGDQCRLGLGMVGFDVSELGWSESEDVFATQKRFLLELVDAALNREGWEHLPSIPGAVEERLFPLLRQLREMVEQFPREGLTPPPEYRWPEGPPENGLCELHRVYLHETGCLLCNDASYDEPAPHRSP
ncbi:MULTISPECIES: hypothetical protein [Myxococcus]|uniref:Uncharacterized protein n=1 Tax=Myxococcus llanfairpwllgwyngyllgogerychwyrndrobwllllantysiliogogogochensis TaxID=2590453 RepID=A0A540WZF7_9BACT|nr:MULTISPECIES: hypothetical protein [Myxococcus]NTX04678.1 hypothetical protein [Myxococcus sp. CA040A]TQF14381.1 hypothetical protein FJV41_18970 [Myxococcus llanfairpwllgwyngyllgogerychwyrndrobwllllantysiliogogogochensis]